MDVSGIIWFIVAHVAFIAVSHFIMKRIDIVVYLAFLILLLVFYLELSLNDVLTLSGAAVSHVENFIGK